MMSLNHSIVKTRFFGLSLAVHILIVGIFWLKIDREPEKKRAQEIIQLEIHSETMNSTIVKNPSAGRGRKGRGAQSSSRLLVEKILKSGYSGGRAWLPPKSGERQSEGSWEESGYTENDDPNVAWGAGAGTFERIQDASIMDRIHAKIDGMLFYPGILARHQIQGVVNTRLVLNSEGSCHWKMMKISAADPHLRIYILHLLKKVCEENFKKYLRDRVSTNIDMSFEFSISEQPTTEELIRQNQKVIGNVLLFFRNSHQSAAEWQLGPFRGLFPLPLVSVDFDWLFENFDKYINHRDPLKEYRH